MTDTSFLHHEILRTFIGVFNVGLHGSILDHHPHPARDRARGVRLARLDPRLRLPHRVSKLTQDALGRGRDSADVLPKPSRTEPHKPVSR
jgi:hypothetical protein